MMSVVNFSFDILQWLILPVVIQFSTFKESCNTKLGREKQRKIKQDDDNREAENAQTRKRRMQRPENKLSRYCDVEEFQEN